MNRMQKMAWVGLLWGLWFNISFALIFVAFYFLPNYRRVLFLILFPGLVFLIAAQVWSLRKQSSVEPECDERDNQISRQAVVVALIAMCLLIYISDAVMLLWTGSGGHILTALLPIIHFWLGSLTLSVYYAAMLILYRKGRAADE